MGQNGSEFLTTCAAKYREDWKEIIEYYYKGSVAGGYKPPAPVTSADSPGGTNVTVHFPSRVAKDGVKENVGWHYQVAVRIKQNSLPDSPYIYDTRYDRGWNKDDKTIHTSATLPTGPCYYARASNPVGWSSWVVISETCS